VWPHRPRHGPLASLLPQRRLAVEADRGGQSPVLPPRPCRTVPAWPGSLRWRAASCPPSVRRLEAAPARCRHGRRPGPALRRFPVPRHLQCCLPSSCAAWWSPAAWRHPQFGVRPAVPRLCLSGPPPLVLLPHVLSGCLLALPPLLASLDAVGPWHGSSAAPAGPSCLLLLSCPGMVLRAVGSGYLRSLIVSRRPCVLGGLPCC
jgi:hypothetical protein